MAYLTGANTVIGAKIATTFGTATSIGSGDKMEVESLNQSTNPEELAAAPIGSGQIMANESRQGAEDPRISIEKIAHYHDSGAVCLAQFHGNDHVTSLGSGGYIHSLTNNENFNGKWITAAFQLFSAASATNNQAEFPSCTVTNVRFSAANPPDYARLGLELVANERKISSTTNTYATLETATLADTERVIFDVNSVFRINAIGGSALSSGDEKAILSAELVLSREQQSAREARGTGATGNGQPIPSGAPPYIGTLTIRFKSLEDATYFYAADIGTEYKAEVVITGSLIGGSIYKRFAYHLPRLKIIEDPQYNLTTAAVNDHTVVFKCLAATSSPTGMIDVYPYPTLINTKSTTYLA